MKIKIRTLNNTGIAHLFLIIGIVVTILVLTLTFRVVQRANSTKDSATTKQQNTTEKKLTDNATSLNGIPVNGGQTANSSATQAAGSATSTPATNKSTSPTTTTPKSSPIQGSQPSSTSTGGTSSTPAAPPTSVDGDTPLVALTYPSYWGQTVSGTITMTATASNSSGIQKVVFMIRRIGYAAAVYTETDTSAPYSATFNTTTLPNGGSEYTVEAQAFDNAGKANLASHRINIQN